MDFIEDMGTMAEELDDAQDCRDSKMAIEYSIYLRNAEIKRRNNAIRKERERLLNSNGIKKNEYIIICDAREKKSINTLMYVDRRKSKDYWWTHDLSIVLHGTLEEMSMIAAKLKFNNPRAVSVKRYLELR